MDCIHKAFRFFVGMKGRDDVRFQTSLLEVSVSWGKLTRCSRR